jgi:TerC family integral membrane protein
LPVSVGTPTTWAVTLIAVVVLIGLDFLLTRRPHEVSIREAALWSAFYIALPLAFGGWIWWRYGTQSGTEFMTGYLVEKSLSVDNLFVFMLLLSAFAVPNELRQRVLLYGIVGALVLRGVFIAVGAAAIEAFSATFLIFGLILAATAVKVFLDARSGHEPETDIGKLRVVRALRRVLPVTDEYAGPRLTVRREGSRGRAVTPLFVVVVAVLTTDVVFAIDSVPAVFGITQDPYLVFATNAFALLGLRALYFLLQEALSRLVHLGYGLAFILLFIGVKLVLHWAHGIWPATPEVPTLASLLVIVGSLGVVTVTSLVATGRARRRDEAAGVGGGAGGESAVDAGGPGGDALTGAALQDAEHGGALRRSDP